MGAGAWGTALAKVLADAGNDVTLWARRPELADEINDTHRNGNYLGDVELPKTVKATSDPAAALTGACTAGTASAALIVSANIARTTFSRPVADKTGASRVLAAPSRLTAMITSTSVGAPAGWPLMVPSCQLTRWARGELD